MPCLNEERTVASCVTEAVGFLREYGVLGEVVVADNGSTDRSVELAVEAGARVVHVSQPGYGAALLGGIKSCSSRFVIMGDSDMSYDFSDLGGFLTELRNGNDLVMGNRFAGGIERGAMPILHRVLGNPVLSWLARSLFGSSVRDFHCGLRGFDRAKITSLELCSPGMEFASEMVVAAELSGFSIAQVPTRLRHDGRDRPPHLRTWRDGFRHLNFLLQHRPRLLLTVPGATVSLLALLLIIAIQLPLPTGLFSSMTINSSATLLALLAVGANLLVAGTGMRKLVRSAGLKYVAIKEPKVPRWFRVEVLAAAALIIFTASLAGFFSGIVLWWRAGFGELDTEVATQIVLPAVFGISASTSLFIFAILISLAERIQLELTYNHKTAAEQIS